ncbi:DUF2938 domain-containing protein [Leptospira levettii]|uniref:DUF2938 domain-containing protein n=1 Tax=Leptospira levettii TaxID=2023178 RepID=UPI001EEB911E|nr:DUF2938 domain-containing protein [Leptospira levettii]MCG6149963.1 DUF2938 domain-containing protein [Leptospira levettii]
MDHLVSITIQTILIGIGATMAMDLWRFFLQKTFKVNSLDLGLLGRWVGYCAKGKFFHSPIAKSAVIPGESIIGWISHYAIGIFFASLLPIIWGVNWLENPTIEEPFFLGLSTIIAPWFLMQPAMGIGIAASKTPKPFQVRIRNIAIHTVYGLGLYGTALLTHVYLY